MVAMTRTMLIGSKPTDPSPQLYPLPSFTQSGWGKQAAKYQSDTSKRRECRGKSGPTK